MHRRHFLALAAAPLLRANSAAPKFSTRAVDLVKQSNVIDMLGLLTLNYRLLVKWQAAPENFTAKDFAKLSESGIDVFNPAVAFPTDKPYEVTRNWFSRWNYFLTQHRDFFVRVDVPSDLTKAKKDGKIGIILGMQDAHHLRNLDDVDAFYKVGQRITQLTYNAANRLGYGCQAAVDKGLTIFGAEVVGRMNAVGMAIDISHCGERTSLDAIQASDKPVLITHSNCRALCPQIARCKTDEIIKAAAAKGGVIGITSVRHFVRAQDPVTIEDVLNHFDYAIKIAGIEHVGIGSDMDLDGRDGPTGPAQYDIAGLNDTRRIYELTEGLIRRGYSDANIAMILGQNFQRALGEIWNLG